MSRNRSQYHEFVRTSKVWSESSDAPGAWTTDATNVYTTLETMTDVNDNPVGNNVCIHDKWTYEPQSVTTVFAALPYNDPVHTHYNTGFGYGATNVDLVEYPSPDYSDVADFWERCLTTVNTTVNLGEIVGEWRDVRQMIKKPLSSLREDWRHRAGQSSSKRLAKVAAGTWLEGRYGWIPFANDLKEVIRLKDKVDKALKAYRESCNIPQRVHMVSFANADIESSEPSPSGDSYFYVYDQCVSATIRHVLWADVKRPYLPPDKLLSLITGTALGGHKVFETIWNLTPFSHVIDWFTDSFVSTANELDKLIRSAFYDVPEVTIVNSGSSTKIEEEWHHRIFQKVSGYSGARAGQNYETRRRVSYSRSPGVPSFGELNQSDKLNLIHLADAAAMLTSMVK